MLVAHEQTVSSRWPATPRPIVEPVTGSRSYPRTHLSPVAGFQSDVSVHPAVREARESDVERIHQLVRELAHYERAPRPVKATPEHLRTALFGPQPAAYALVAEVEGEVVGFALYFLNFSTWEGVHGVYLEDLFVQPEHRGTGLGKALLSALAEIAVARGYARVEWWVLD